MYTVEVNSMFLKATGKFDDIFDAIQYAKDHEIDLAREFSGYDVDIETEKLKEGVVIYYTTEIDGLKIEVFTIKISRQN